MKDQMTLDFEQSRINANNGMTVALLNAESHIVGWAEDAFECLKSYLETHDGYFQAEEVRLYATDMGLPLPPNSRAWGGVMMKAANAKLIRKVGIKATSNPVAHAANAGVWIRINHAKA